MKEETKTAKQTYRKKRKITPELKVHLLIISKIKELSWVSKR